VVHSVRLKRGLKRGDSDTERSKERIVSGACHQYHCDLISHTNAQPQPGERDLKQE
jgi:hypothetical protein